MEGLKYYSQVGQDKVALEILNYKNKGFFIDIGANDGVTFSNTKTMEELGWQGICIEPDSDMFEALKRNRNCECVNAAVSDKNGKAEFTRIVGKAQMLSGLTTDYCEAHLNRIKRETEANGEKIEKIEITTITFDKLLEQIDKPHVIDFVSIDTEGNEMKILQSIDFKRWNITILAVENNYNDESMRTYMTGKGYHLSRCRSDDIYIRGY